MTTMATIRQALPWWARIGAKLLLARMPVSYAFWKRLRLFEHGSMDRPESAIDTFVAHALAAGVLVDGRLVSRAANAGADHFEFLELGPGDSVASAIVGRALGATGSWLVDAGDFASASDRTYERLCAALRARGLRAAPAASRDAMLAATGGRYRVRGTDSLEEIPSAALDYGYSNAVLEHVPAAEFDRVVVHLFRILRPGATSVHRVDLRDHLGGGLANLRLSDACWESAPFRRSGFYTNRIRFSDMLGRFRAAGFEVDVLRCDRWERLPIDRARLSARFAALSDEELRVRGFDVRLTRPAGRSA
jgi:SAM-dependent methyltransferase